jgi:type IV fimbrial biogenesis protein FimT
MRTYTSGFTLIDLIASAVIIIIVLGLAAPAFHRLVERNKAATGINWIVRAINLTRISAVDYGSLTTLCPTQDNQRCGGNWYERVMVFTDPNDDRAVNEGEHIIVALDFPHRGSTLKWRAFRNKQYLQMTSQGFTNYQNGNFVYCSKNQNPLFARQIVLNRQGRVKKSVDRNNDGLIEDRYGKHLRC